MSDEIGRNEVGEYLYRRRTNERMYGCICGSLLPVEGEEKQWAPELRVRASTCFNQTRDRQRIIDVIFSSVPSFPNARQTTAFRIPPTYGQFTSHPALQGSHSRHFELSPISSVGVDVAYPASSRWQLRVCFQVVLSSLPIADLQRMFKIKVSHKSFKID